MLKLATKFAPQRSLFEAAYGAGLRYVEFWLDVDYLHDWRRVAELAQQYPFDYVLHFPNRKDMTDEQLAALVDLHRALGCRALVIHQPHFALYADRLRAIDSALELAVENHRLRPDDFRNWAEVSPGLTLDVEHLWKFTLEDCPLLRLLEQLDEFLDEFAEKLLHLHMPGYRPGGDEHRPMYFNRDLVFGVFDLLEKHRYDGFMVSEIHTEYQIANEMQMDLLLFNTWRAQHSRNVI